MHDRYSDKANSEQDLAQMANIITARLKRDYTVVAIYADHRATKYNNLRDSLVDCRPFQENGIDNQDVGKLCHLRLLIKLYEQKKAIKLKGIIGNTSGTLDVAAFVGHNVFDIHKFSERFDYQDLRLMLQSTFLVVQKASDIMVMNGKNKPNQLLINMDSWIESGGEQPICSSYLSKPTINKGFHFLASVCNLQVGERGEWKKPAFMDSYLEEMEKYLVEVGFIKKGGLDLGFERS